MDSQIIDKYFCQELSAEQKNRFSHLGALYADWNSRINVISRKDMDQFYVRHVLHSLAIARVCRFDSGARILDVGTGGGFPGIPLAIMFPEARFTLADSIGKKITVVKGVAESLGLNNVMAVNARVETLPDTYDYVVSRAVTDMKAFLGWTWKKIDSGKHGSLNSGVLYLKGGDLSEELSRAGRPYELYNISDMFTEDFFETKKVVYIKKG